MGEPKSRDVGGAEELKHRVITGVAADLRAILKSFSVSHTALGKAAGISDATVSNFMNNRRGMKFSTLQAICRAYGVEVEFGCQQPERDISLTVSTSAEVGERINRQLVIDGRPPIEIDELTPCP